MWRLSGCNGVAAVRARVEQAIYRSSPRPTKVGRGQGEAVWEAPEDLTLEHAHVGTLHRGGRVSVRVCARVYIGAVSEHIRLYLHRKHLPLALVLEQEGTALPLAFCTTPSWLLVVITPSLATN